MHFPLIFGQNPFLWKFIINQMVRAEKKLAELVFPAFFSIATSRGWRMSTFSSTKQCINIEKTQRATVVICPSEFVSELLPAPL
jgi:hypothetical protein